jgi:hypothetical protein
MLPGYLHRLAPVRILMAQGRILATRSGVEGYYGATIRGLNGAVGGGLGY